ncbi:hypothetical protein VXI04_004326 [Vibrio vulnificus]|nr:hypothetical protein [Vibrio vulnificus]EHZ2756112.1 hypothetical protein [Vibrio vulnificus]EHZ2765048.1 hypothetical protein [Vibrio vulnificus]EKD8805038.1 hypothetical protein [Vibrio vulnificus]EKD9323339.1 hypothetical protein [Vibrio vulnificus]
MLVEFIGSPCLEGKQDDIESKLRVFLKQLLESEIGCSLTHTEISDLQVIVCFDSAITDACCVRHNTESNKFLIKLSKRSFQMLGNVLAHELCHVIQMLNGSLVPILEGDGVAIWKGERFELSKIKHNKRPWEMEAKSFAYKK